VRSMLSLSIANRSAFQTHIPSSGELS
jgi:hypothetical protein